MAARDDSEIAALIDTEVADSLGYISDKLSAFRAKALEFYLGEAKGDLAAPDIEGRSSVVSTDVADAIEQVMPSMLRVFTSNDRAVKFEPQTPQDEPYAEQATDWANYVLHRQNAGFTILYNWIKDALLQRMGVVKVWWDPKLEETRETYEDISDQQLEALRKQDGVTILKETSHPDEEGQEERDKQVTALQQQITKQKALQQSQPPQPAAPQAMAGSPPSAGQSGPQPMPQPLPGELLLQQLESTPVPNRHDVVVNRAKYPDGHICIENIPPEEFLVSRRTKSMRDCDFCAHRTSVTASDLIAMGFDPDTVDHLGGESDNTVLASAEAQARASWIDSFQGNQKDTDPAQRRHWVTEAYIRLDQDDDGIYEWWRVLKCGPEILEKEECDGPPFAVWSPVLMPHQLVGLSLADFLMDLQRISTTLHRQYLDALYLSTSPRTFAVENQVNIDDLLNNRPGGIVRMKQPGMAGPLITAESGGAALDGIQWINQVKEQRTGLSLQSQGLDPNVLKVQATVAMQMQSAAQQRMELMVRVFAETGFKELFKQILKLTSLYSTRPQIIRLRDTFIEVDPTAWSGQFDVTISVGLGSGDKTQEAAQAGMLLQTQLQLLPLGIVKPENLYATARDLLLAQGKKNISEYFTDPSQQPPPTGGHAPDPNVIKAQIDAQQKTQQAQAQQQADAQKFMAQSQLTAQENDKQRQHDFMLEQMKAQSATEIESMRGQQQSNARLMELASGIIAAREGAQNKNLIDGTTLDQTSQSVDSAGQLAEVMQAIHSMAASVAAPKQVVRGPDGKVSHVIPMQGPAQ